MMVLAGRVLLVAVDIDNCDAAVSTGDADVSTCDAAVSTGDAATSTGAAKARL